ncbi:MAG: hypothetical protein R3185_02295 [Candidatus Thermoplasmatota archaeon]|nr:hypothetical protein [Candidatus Thermoplasmatota archaeon]
MPEHRWTLPCEMMPEEAEEALGAHLSGLASEGWELIPHVETVGFFGWTLRDPTGRAVGISIPQPGGPPALMIRTDHPELGEEIVAHLTEAGPLAGRDANHQVREAPGLEDGGPPGPSA